MQSLSKVLEVSHRNMGYSECMVYVHKTPSVMAVIHFHMCRLYIQFETKLLEVL